MVLALPAAAQQHGIHWQQDIESAKTTAKQTGRLVLVHFWAPTCQPCLNLERNVFTQPGVASAIESQYVPVKLNADENQATAAGFGIARLPTDIVLTPEGQVVGRLISPPTPAAYVAELSRVATQHVTRLGETYARTTARAPAPPQLSATYPASSSTVATFPPTVVSAGPELSGGNSMTAPIVASTPPSATARGPVGTQSVPTGSFAAWTATSQPQNSLIPAQPVSAAVQSAATSPSYAPNPAAVAQNVTALAQAPAKQPSQIDNPYAMPSPNGSMPVVASSATAQMGWPAANASATAATQPAQGPTIRALPPNSPPLGFEGYCPVSMRTQWKWVPGDPRWAVVHLGKTYWCAGASEQQQFLADPHRYSPALSGMDPVLAIDHRQQVPGKREHSIDYDTMFYMFASEATLQQFAANPERYATSVRQAMGIPRGRFAR
jgi:protein disulfide-isomerase